MLGGTRDLKPRRVLVVAADAAIRRHIRDNLFVSGYAVFEAKDRRSALAATQDFFPHLVVIDLSGSPSHEAAGLAPEDPAPGSAGRPIDLELIGAITTATGFKPLILAITGDAGGLRASDAVEAGAFDYVAHPFCIGELLVRADRLLGVALPPPRNEVRPREHQRVSDLLDDEERITLGWITLGGLEQMANVGVDGHGALSMPFAGAISEHLPGARSYWAGTERIVILGSTVASGAETSTALKESLEKLLAEISLPMELKLKVRAGVRNWSEGKASFLARVTGRLSHGALPTAPLEEGHPPLASTAAVGSHLDRQVARRELGRLNAGGGL